MRLARLLGLTPLFVAAAAPASADATLFVGSNPTPVNRTARGFALGVGLLIVGFEFEYSSTPDDVDEAAPSLRTGSGNVLLQTPFPILGLQPYLTTGAGVYRERLGDRQETHVGLNSGGGVKISLLGPLRARLDYRVFNLRGEPLHSTVHRVYAGVNLAF
ncbi:MAG TPA: hypothetical protein VNI78_05340 [Vicinamibacterales bacterium]|nr:hypothetical protein [Vicinamibacterales bacterium]